MRCARVGDSLRFLTRCRFDVACPEHWQPYDIGLQVRAWDLLENSLFNFGGPPKTNPSGRIDQEKQPHFTYVLVELGPNRLEVSRKPGDGRCSIR